LGVLGTPKYPPPERPLSPSEPLRCPLGPWSAPATPAWPAGAFWGELTPPTPPGAAKALPTDTPLDAFAPQAPPTGCWWVGGAPWRAAGRPGGGKPTQKTHLHTAPQTGYCGHRCVLNPQNRCCKPTQTEAPVLLCVTNSIDTHTCCISGGGLNTMLAT